MASELNLSKNFKVKSRPTEVPTWNPNPRKQTNFEYVTAQKCKPTKTLKEMAKEYLSDLFF